MLTDITEAHRNIALQDPTNRAIISTYWNTEVEKLNKEVYVPVSKKFPSLNYVINEMKKNEDPIEKLNKTKEEVKSFEMVKGLTSMLNLFMDDADEDIKSIKTMISKIEPITKIINAYTPLQEALYVSIAEAAKQVGNEYNIKPINVFSNVNYLDEVKKIAIPTRTESENLTQIGQKLSFEMIDMAKGFIAFAKKSGQMDDESLKEASGKLPTRKALKAVHIASNKYLSKENDRIYSI